MSPELISQIFQMFIIPILSALSYFIVSYLRAKRDEIKSKTENERAYKYADLITDTISRCVIATNQTFVDELKKEGKFDADAQQAAFQKTLNAVVAILSEDAKKYITETFGDLTTYLIEMIEAQVAIAKK